MKNYCGKSRQVQPTIAQIMASGRGVKWSPHFISLNPIDRGLKQAASHSTIRSISAATWRLGDFGCPNEAAESKWRNAIIVLVTLTRNMSAPS
jgi:hypothetical protein